MYKVDIYAKVRRAVMVEGISQREVARRYGLDRKTVAKAVAFSIPPGYRRKEAPTARKLGPFVGIINQILEADRSVLKKQRHTAQRIFDRLRDEYGYSGGYTAVREFVAREHVRSREMFVPLAHRAGHAQADFGQADIYLNGAKTRIHYFCLDLPHSDAIFVKAYPAETTEAFLEAQSPPLPGCKASHNRSCTTTPRGQWRRSLAEANAGAPAHLANCKVITCSKTGSGGRPKAATG